MLGVLLFSILDSLFFAVRADRAKPWGLNKEGAFFLLRIGEIGQ